MQGNSILCLTGLIVLGMSVFGPAAFGQEAAALYVVRPMKHEVLPPQWPGLITALRFDPSAKSGAQFAVATFGFELHTTRNVPWTDEISSRPAPKESQ